MESIQPAKLSISSPPPRAKRKVEEITNPVQDDLISGKIKCYSPAILKKMLFYNMIPSTREVEKLQAKLSFNDFDNIFVKSVKTSFARMQKKRSVKFLSILIDCLRSFLRFSTSSGAKKLRVELKSALAYLSNAQITFKSDNPKRLNQISFKSKKDGISKGEGAYACGSHVISFLSQSFKGKPYNVKKILTEGVIRHRKLNHPRRKTLSTIEEILGPINPDLQMYNGWINEKSSARSFPWIIRFYSVLKKIKASTSGLLCCQNHCLMCRVLSDKKVELFDSEKSYAPSTKNNILQRVVHDSGFSKESKPPTYKVETKDGAYHVRFANSYFAALFLSIHLKINYTWSINTNILFVPVKVIPSLN